MSNVNKFFFVGGCQNAVDYSRLIIFYKLIKRIVPKLMVVMLMLLFQGDFIAPIVSNPNIVPL